MVLGYETRALVSTDYTNDPRSSIVDALSTQVVGNRLVKVLAWYDNEMGYVNRMVDIARCSKVTCRRSLSAKICRRFKDGNGQQNALRDGSLWWRRTRWRGHEIHHRRRRRGLW